MKPIIGSAIAVGLVALLASASGARELPRNVFAVSPDEEIEDLLFLGDTRPALIRLHIRVDGEGHRGRWREFVLRLHREADADGDGILGRPEANKALDRINQLKTINLNAVRKVPRRQLLVPPEVVTFNDLMDQMKTVVEPFRIERRLATETSGDEAMFRLLDRDGDGHLSHSELSAITSSLARLDLDDDETLTAEELGTFRNPALANRVNPVTGIARNATPSDDGVLIAASGQQPSDLARLILRRYVPGSRAPTSARDREATLRPGDLTIDREAFARIDSDRDGSLGVTELENAVKGAADLELIVRLGHRDPGEAAIEYLRTIEERPPFGAPHVRWVGNLLLIELASTFIELGTEAEGADPFSAIRGILEARFQAADLDRSGTLENPEIRKSPQLAAVFIDADRDRDGHLTDAEWKFHLDRQAKVIGLPMVLQAAEQGPSFLDLLDQDRDRKLGSREQLDAARRILLEDRDGDERVSLREFAKHHRWTIARGQVAPVVQPPILVDQRPHPPRTRRRPGMVPQDGSESGRRPLPSRIPRHPRDLRGIRRRSGRPDRRSGGGASPLTGSEGNTWVGQASVRETKGVGVDAAGLRMQGEEGEGRRTVGRDRAGQKVILECPDDLRPVVRAGHGQEHRAREVEGNGRAALEREELDGHLTVGLRHVGRGAERPGDRSVGVLEDRPDVVEGVVVGGHHVGFEAGSDGDYPVVEPHPAAGPRRPRGTRRRARTAKARAPTSAGSIPRRLERGEAGAGADRARWRETAGLRSSDGLEAGERFAIHMPSELLDVQVGDSTVQEVPYAKPRDRLLADGQILAYTPPVGIDRDPGARHP